MSGTGSPLGAKPRSAPGSETQPGRVIYAKTSEGQAALREHGRLTPRERTALILLDGRRTGANVCVAANVSAADLARLERLGYIAPVDASEDRGR